MYYLCIYRNIRPYDLKLLQRLVVFKRWVTVMFHALKILDENICEIEYIEFPTNLANYLLGMHNYFCSKMEKVEDRVIKRIGKVGKFQIREDSINTIYVFVTPRPYYCWNSHLGRKTTLMHIMKIYFWIFIMNNLF